MIASNSSIQGILWNIVDHISPCHTTQLATEYLNLTMADVETIECSIRDNPRAVIVRCLETFLHKNNEDEKALYERLKQAGVKQGLVPRVCLEKCKGTL